MFELNNFDALQIGMAGPDKIRSWSHGEVTKSETINYRTQRPEKDGLFCEKIFGPEKDWQCGCKKYKKPKHKNFVCEVCGVKVTTAKVRRERMGHIELACPVTHIWYFNSVSSKIATMLDLPPKELAQVSTYGKYIVLDPGNSGFKYKDIISGEQYLESRDSENINFEVGTGAEAMKRLLEDIDLKKEEEELKKIIASSKKSERAKATKRLQLVSSFLNTDNDPSWMVLTVLPVIPPDLRPLVQLDGGRHASSDLNELYRRVVNRNATLKNLLEKNAAEPVLNNSRRLLQEAVDQLLDNGRRGKAATGPGNRPFKSLTSSLCGKQGRFRQNLLGKRVDYSGRSVIVVGPELKMYQCGLPKEMALELFKPFVMCELMKRGKANSTRSAKTLAEKATDDVWEVLEYVIKEHPVLLNRAPSLHRLSIQAFEPILVEGRAIKLHPLACSAFNADFDGDQMAVHVPLSVEAQTEARVLMLASNNIMKLSDGRPVCSPSQDMVIGCYYLTMDKPGAKGEGKVFADVDEAKMAYANGFIELQSAIEVRVTKVIDGVEKSKRINTTVGRIIFNEAIPQDLGMCKRETEDDMFKLEINEKLGKDKLQQIVENTFITKGSSETSKVLDNIKTLGFKYSTVGAITTSIFDMTVPEKKKSIIAEAQKKILTIEELYDIGHMSQVEKYKQVVDVWTEVNENVTAELVGTLTAFNPINMMSESKARGGIKQIAQLSGMRGLMSDTKGRTLETPILSSFREGLSVLEYFISSHGSRKGLADTALNTSKSGYLTRRLVDVAQDVCVTQDDCCAGARPVGTVVSEIWPDNVELKDRTPANKGKLIEGLKDRIVGRFAAEDVVSPKTKEILVSTNEMIMPAVADKIVESGIKEVKIRSIFTCASRKGVCAKCYGKDMASNDVVRIGEAVGVIAAQSIGEPGTQLTMRTFHTGGIAGADDITQGLPRVDDLFRASDPKNNKKDNAILADVDGKVTGIVEKESKTYITTKNDNGTESSYLVSHKSRIKKGIAKGSVVKAGDPLTDGTIYSQDVYRTKGRAAAQLFILKEVQAVYRSQSIVISDKHIETIIRQMFKKICVDDGGETGLIPGTFVDSFEFADICKKALEEGKAPARGKVKLLGTIPACLKGDGFLAPASFQETAKVLTNAAIENRIDRLEGLKENVIIGKLIPAGTGMNRYKNIFPVEKVDETFLNSQEGSVEADN